jgi:hypothetical protein
MVLGLFLENVMKTAEDIHVLLRSVQISRELMRQVAADLDCQKPPCTPVPDVQDPPSTKSPLTILFRESILNAAERVSVVYQLILNLEKSSQQAESFANNEMSAFTSYILNSNNPGYVLSNPFNPKGLRGADLLVLSADLQRISESTCSFNALKPIFTNAANLLMTEGLKRLKSENEACVLVHRQVESTVL